MHRVRRDDARGGPQADRDGAPVRGGADPLLYVEARGPRR